MTERYIRLGWGRWCFSVRVRVWRTARPYAPQVSKPVSATLGPVVEG